MSATASESNSRRVWIGIVATALAVAAMAKDHLLPGDWPAFLASAALSIVVAAFLFTRFVPGIERRPDGPKRAAVAGLLCSILAIVPGIAFLWLGFPIVIAGAGVALGLLGLAGERRRLAQVAVVVGALGLVGGFVVEVTAG